MIVSWDWLSEYVGLEMPVEELTHRLTMAGLNVEGTDAIDGDLAVDLEVTSNRPDCLGHIGVAREISVLFGEKLQIPGALPPTAGDKTSAVTSVDIECVELCPRYIARVIRGVQVGPSPDWLKHRLQTIGIPAINNVADVTNYVLMECGQPLHAFDFDKLEGRRIVVRRVRRRGESLTAINQRAYELSAEMCVIADAARPVALGGVMGGLETEISNATVNLLIETADFAPLSIRNTARELNLHSESSYRFERRVDPHQLDWASRRCCELILQLAGGELLDEAVAAGPGTEIARLPITLRFEQIPRILGIDVPADEATEILTALGCELRGRPGDKQLDRPKPHPPGADKRTFTPPTWRRDLTREIDLIEEVARIHGYDEIPDDAPLPLGLSSRSRRDRVIQRVRDVLCAAAFFEAVTLSFVSEETCDLFQPRGDRPKLRVDHSSRRQENVLRQSLIPSLLLSRRENERRGTFDAELFEIAKVYLQAAPEGREGDVEPAVIGLVSGRSFGEVKGVIETLVSAMNHAAEVSVQESDRAEFVPGRGAEILLDRRHLGWMGELDRGVTDRVDLRDAVVAAELELAALESIFDEAPCYTPVPQFPAIERDLNFVLDESVGWQQLEQVVRETAGPLFESITFAGQYRGRQIDAGKKSYVVRISYRAADRTLTSDEIKQAEEAVIAGCVEKLGATLRTGGE